MLWPSRPLSISGPGLPPSPENTAQGFHSRSDNRRNTATECNLDRKLQEPAIDWRRLESVWPLARRSCRSRWTSIPLQTAGTTTLIRKPCPMFRKVRTKGGSYSSNFIYLEFEESCRYIRHTNIGGNTKLEVPKSQGDALTGIAIKLDDPARFVLARARMILADFDHFSDCARHEIDVLVSNSAPLCRTTGSAVRERPERARKPSPALEVGRIEAESRVRLLRHR